MADVHSKEVRRYNMACIKAKNTVPEITVRKYLFNKGFRYRINVCGLPGKPDIVLKKYFTAIFINGCFWHGHLGCKYFVIPKTRSFWWESKIEQTRKRDNEAKTKLIQLGWNVIVIWECELKGEKRAETLLKLENTLYSNFLDKYRK